MLFTFSALISNIYWCSIVSHQQILMVRHVAPVEIIGVANAAPVSTPMAWMLQTRSMVPSLIYKVSFSLRKKIYKKVPVKLSSAGAA